MVVGENAMYFDSTTNGAYTPMEHTMLGTWEYLEKLFLMAHSLGKWNRIKIYKDGTSLSLSFEGYD